MLNRQLVFTFVLIFGAGFLVWLIVRDYPQKVEIQRQLEDIETKTEALIKEEERQKSLIDYLNSESYLEKQARLRLNLKKEGEEVVFVYQKKEEPGQIQEEKREENSFLSKLKELINIFLLRR